MCVCVCVLLWFINVGWVRWLAVWLAAWLVSWLAGWLLAEWPDEWMAAWLSLLACILDVFSRGSARCLYGFHAFPTLHKRGSGWLPGLVTYIFDVFSCGHARRLYGFHGFLTLQFWRFFDLAMYVLKFAIFLKCVECSHCRLLLECIFYMFCQANLQGLRLNNEKMIFLLFCQTIFVLITFSIIFRCFVRVPLETLCEHDFHAYAKVFVLQMTLYICFVVFY